MKGLKKFISIALSVLMVISAFPLTALANTDIGGEYKGVVWQYTASTDTLYINTTEKTGLTGYNNPITSKNETYLPTVYTDGNGIEQFWNGSFSKLIIGNRVTAIGTSVRLGYDEVNKYYNYPNLNEVEFEKTSSLLIINSYNFYKLPITSIEIPASVTEIDQYAFSETALEEITVPSTVKTMQKYTFANCKSLKRATVNAQVTTIGDEAFYNCQKLSEVSLPSTLTKIGTEAFYKCIALESLDLPQGIKSISSKAFANSGIKTLVLPDTVTAIYANAFNSSKLESVALNEGITTIGDGAFSGTMITSVALPSSVTTFGKNVFDGCSNLETADLSRVTFTELPASTFRECKALAVLDAPSIESVNQQALYYTSSLKSLNMPNLRAAYNSAFSYSGIESISFALPDNSSTGSFIGDSAFESCTSLTKIDLPIDLSVINARAFRGCSRLQRIKIPDYTKTICANAFSNTQMATFVVMGKKINIHESALYATDGVYSESLVIRGYSDSTAKAFADEHGITFSVIDELDEDDDVYAPTPEEVAANKLKGTWDNGTWNISGKHLYIYGEGAMNNNKAIDCNGDEFTYSQIAQDNSITRVFIQDGITSIPDRFLCVDDGEISCLTYVYIPNSLEKIGAYAFTNTTIRSVFPNNKTFESVSSSLKFVLFPYSVTEIGEYAFANCSGLVDTTVMLPFDLAEVSEGLFYNSPVQSVGMFGYVEKIGKKAFANCDSLSSIDVPCNAQLYVDNEHPQDNSIGTNDNGLTTNVTITCREDSPAYRYAQEYNLATNISNGESYASGTITTSTKSGLTTSTYGLRWYYYPEDKSLHIALGSDSSSGLWNKKYKDKIIAADADTAVSITEDTMIRNLIEKGTINTNSSRPYVSGSVIVDRIIVDEGITELSCSDLFSAFNPKHIVLPESLNKLQYHTFRGCDRLESVYIPMSVTSIEDNAFADCYNLTGVNLGGITKIDNDMFANRKKLKFVNMNSVKTIGDNAFSRCTELQEIVIPDSTATIGTRAFYKCIKAQSVTLGTGVTAIAKNAFDDLAYCEKITVNANLPAETTIGAFNDIGATTLGVDLVFGNGVQSADFSAFCNTKVINIKLGADIKNVTNTQYLPHAQRIELDSANTSYYVDSNCLYSNTNSLVYVPAKQDTVNIKDGTISIADYALYGTRIVGITVPTTVTAIGSYAFSNAKYLKNLEIKKGTSTIGASAFENCSSLRSFYAPSTLTTIGDSAFKNCTRMASVILPTKLTAIGAEAFMGCSSLVGMVVNENVATIGERAYMDCLNLEEIYIWYNTQIGNNAFDNDEKLTIYTMVGSDAYRYAREYGIPYNAFTDEDVFYDLCGDKTDIFAGYLGFCTDGHGEIEWLTVYEADCENDGYIIGVCEYCSEILDEKHINATGHDYKLTTRIAATDTTRGMKVYTCQSCGESYCEYVEPSGDEAKIDTHTVTGSVVIASSKEATSGKAPARNASILINDMVVAKTDRNGEFTLTLETGTYEAQIVYAYGFTRTIYIIVEDEDLVCEPIAIIGCDFNKDGVIDNDDLTLFQMVISATANDLSYLDYVDMDNNGYINAKDRAYITNCRGINSTDYTYAEIIIQK